MDSTPIIATGEAAEDLFKYLVAYGNLRDSLKFDLKHETLLEDYVTIGIIPQEEELIAST